MSAKRCHLPLVLLCLLASAIPLRAQTAGTVESPDRAQSPVENPVPGHEATPRMTLKMPSWREAAVASSYISLYAGATKVGSRFGLERRFEVVRLESAYAYDLVGHVWAVREIGRLFGQLNRWAGQAPRSADRWGAWGAGFGSLTYMELINGFMPRVRFDPLDPVANALGAWLATGGADFAARHAWAQRFSLEFGYQDWGRVFGPEQSSGLAGNLWHDYPNGRFGLGWGIGPGDGRWARVFLSYEITSLDIEELRNQVGLGIELKPHEWASGWIEAAPGGGALLSFLRWWDDRLLFPGLYFQLYTHDFGPFSDREPFAE